MNTDLHFDWPLCYDAERLLNEAVTAFLRKNPVAQQLAARMREQTGTEFFEWVDHLVLGTDAVEALQAVGFVVESVQAPPDTTVFWHPRAMLPRVLIRRDGGRGGFPSVLAIRPEVLVDFLAAHDLAPRIEGSIGSRFRRALVHQENGTRFEVVERSGNRGFLPGEPSPAEVLAGLRARELWRTRKRDFEDERAAIQHAFARLQEILHLVDQDEACDAFFFEERRYWQARNRAAKVQKSRQDQLGLGWGNHDHHTFRCSRQNFAVLMTFLDRLGFQKRERFYAGAEAGWGAQILEQPTAGIVVFADVDLMPEETTIDFSAHPLPAAPYLRTVGLWCALHGDSFLQAGMHHLEARFDFERLRQQLSEEGVVTMRPFSDFAFLRQAFTEGERWKVRPARVEVLCQAGLITSEQADRSHHEGAIGSHLENLQRKGGFKGFNQHSVSAIIAATDPRRAQLGH